MNHPESQDRLNELDAATSRRLAKLSAMPVDTTRLDAAIGREVGERPGRTSRLTYWITPLRAVAALLLVSLTIAATFWMMSGNEARASAAQRAQWHRDMVNDRVAVMKVASLEEASAALTGIGMADMPTMTGVPQAHAMACCMREIKDKKVAVVLLKDSAGPVTLSVARAEDMKVPRSRPVVRDGGKYYVENFEDLCMVTTERDGRWICLIGQVAPESLIAMAGKLRF
jgi:hypothetical protein